MQRAKLYILLLLAALLFTNCSTKRITKQIQERVEIEAVENISGSLSGGWVVTLRVRNDTAYQPTLQCAEADIYLSGTHTVRASLRSPITLPKRQVASVAIPLDISVKSPLKALALVMQFSSRNFEGIEVSLNSTVEVMGAKRDIVVGRVPAQELIKRIGETAH